jgi:signal transduction histidine kinase
VRHGPHAVEVEVTDDGPGEGAAAPRRLLGMRERVGLVGGELQVERPRSGGHVVRARLPLQGAQ